MEINQSLNHFMFEKFFPFFYIFVYCLTILTSKTFNFEVKLRSDSQCSNQIICGVVYTKTCVRNIDSVLFWVSSSIAIFKLPDVVGSKVTNENCWAEVFSDVVIRNACHTGSVGEVKWIPIVTVMYSLNIS